MRTSVLIALFAGVLLTNCTVSKNTAKDLATVLPVETSINLTAVKDDKLPVNINPGRFVAETVTYHMPRVVQGTYSVGDYGKYLDDFKAFDYKGNEMVTSKIDTNSWTIKNAKNLDYITYDVNDTFDIEEVGGIGGEQPFSPAGTNIEPNNYVLNLHGFIGYFDALKNNQYKLNVTAPTNFVKTSAIQETGEETSEDGKTMTTHYFAPRYFDITDNPMMYGLFDVEEFQVDSIKIVLSVYSPNKIHSAKSLKETIFKMMQAQKRYLGDVNTTPRYDIFLYLSEGNEDSPKGFGALEHNTSTVVVMPEAMSDEALAEGMIDVVSHEFFHIVTPLSVHSADVHYFDYNNPTFSKHLWMYEGVTEYFATLFQVNQGLIDEAAFYDKINDKILGSLQLDDSMSFTVMSKNVLEEPYKSQYYNVYEKGALIGMCIDILMREESNGQRGILSLMKELSKKYGKDKPFKDDKLIDEIVAMTYPSLRTFFDKHVIGTTPINYNEFLEKVGLKLDNGKVATSYIQNGGELIVSANPKDKSLFFNDAVADNSFWKEQGVLPNDIIKSIDGTPVTLESANEVFKKVFMWKPGQDMELTLFRLGKEIKIKTTTTQSYTSGESIQPNPNATEAQIALRNTWLKG